MPVVPLSVDSCERLAAAARLVAEGASQMEAKKLLEDAVALEAQADLARRGPFYVVPRLSDPRE